MKKEEIKEILFLLLNLLFEPDPYSNEYLVAKSRLRYTRARALQSFPALRLQIHDMQIYVPVLSDLQESVQSG